MGFGNCNSVDCQNETSSCSISAEEHNHEHHEHSINDDEHDHIEHNDHLDEGVIDLLTCIWTDIAGDETNCSLYTVSNMESISIEGISKVKLAAILTVFFSPKSFDPESNIILPRVAQFMFDPPLIKANQLRGPPSISC